MTDFRIIHQGSVCTIEALSEPAKAFARENIEVESGMGRPERFTTDWRPAHALVTDLLAYGFDILGDI